MLTEIEEFGEYIEQRGKFQIGDMKLYRIMEDILSTVKLDENVIFFFPYPITLDGEELHHIHFASDILSAVYQELKKSNKICNYQFTILSQSTEKNIRKSSIICTIKFDYYKYLK